MKTFFAFIYFYFFNWVPLHATLSSHYEARNYKEKNEEKDKKDIGKLLKKIPKKKGVH